MHLRMDKVDWNQLRAFLETAETGSLSAAARKLGQSQPTLSRQVAALAAHELGLAATGRSEEVEGVVSVATSDAVAAYLMPKILLQIRQAAPGIQVEVVASDGFSDLLRREADIAIRHVRPKQPELIGRFVRQSSACFYASESWVREHGVPRTAEEAVQHDFIGLDRAGHYLHHLHAVGLLLSSANFRSYADNSVTYWEMVRQGLGIGAIMEEIARETPGMVRVLEDVSPFQLPIWLVTHRELRTARHIRIVFDLLAEILA